MVEIKEALLQFVEKNADSFFAMAQDIFDHPELGRAEYYASNQLTTFLENEGFVVERGIAGIKTAFRATWERGNGGPSIGFMMEYDALKDLGHACGHHLQGPTCIGAALALKAVCDQPFKLVLYGTPDEEVSGGKIDMVNAGCFQDVDVIFSYHTGMNTGCSFSTAALAPHRIVFHGTPAHAAGSPWNGRSAMDAMLLAFHGLEIMREHVKDGCRIHYTIRRDTGPSNIVHEQAHAHITLRAQDRFYLEDMQKRMENVIKGACLMTDTTYELEALPVYWNTVPIQTLRKRALEIAEELGETRINRTDKPGSGSTDVGNVSWVAPNVNLYTSYCDYTSHTAEYRDCGKTEKARRAMVAGSKIFSVLALELIEDAEFLNAVKAEHNAAVNK